MYRTKIHFIGIILLSLALQLFTCRVQAQYYDNSPTFFGGFTAGLNLAQVDGDQFAGYYKTGLNGGAIVHTRLMENVTLSMELLYSQKGSHATKGQLPRGTKSGFVIQSYDIYSQTAQVPVGVNYFFGDKIKGHLGAGFYYAYLVKATSIVNGNETQALYPFKKHEAGFMLNFNIRLFKGLYLNTRFENSIMNIRKTYDPRIEREQQTSRLIALRLMYLFKSESED